MNDLDRAFDRALVKNWEPLDTVPSVWDEIQYVSAPRRAFFQLPPKPVSAKRFRLMDELIHLGSQECAMQLDYDAYRYVKWSKQPA